ncbi:hypothetical protein [Microcoleus asticus]|uniref:hypothetical protein n=1 Tax=Microcoleus asticus TaxID=2815231 RepID=UPI001553A33C|nr:hypothetical protein [Microcoleus asticus]
MRPIGLKISVPSATRPEKFLFAKVILYVGTQKNLDRVRAIDQKKPVGADLRRSVTDIVDRA